MRVFIGVDPRDPVSYNVLRWSIERRATRLPQVMPLILPQLPLKRRGLTDFTFSRYLVPFLCGFNGRAVFMDSDMLCLGDVAELFDYNFVEPVAVVKNRERFEWPSMMVFNNSACKQLTPDYINDERNNPADFSWAEAVAGLPSEWNHCVGYDSPRNDAKLVHYTMGTPGFKERRKCEYAQEWFDERESMNFQGAWLEIHGRSLHRDKVLEELGLGNR